jgi:hypothetical protein
MGIGAAVGMLVGVLGGAVVARDLSLQRSIAELPPSERSFRVDLVGLPAGQDHARLDAEARRALAKLTSAEPLRVVAFRDFYLDGQFVRVAGIDRQPDFVRLLSGRRPRRCDAKLCEVVQIGPRGKPALHEGDIHVVRVGVGELRDPARFGPALSGPLRQEAVHGSYPRAVVLLGPDSDAIERSASLELFSRLRSWVVPLDASDLHQWQIDDLLTAESRAQTILEQADPAFTLAGPDAALLEARARGDTYAARTSLIGGSAGVALLGFAVLAAAGLRRGLAAERRRLVQRGATRGQVLAALLTEVGAIAALGWLLGVAAGTAVVAAIAAAEGLPAGATLWHALADERALVFLGGALVVAAALVGWAVSAEDRDGPRGRIRLLDVALLGAVLAVAIGVSRGALDADGGDTAFLLLLPALVCLAGGLVAARLLGPLMIAAERLARRASVVLRLALLALARAPARTTAAAAFLVVTIGLLVFAASYRSTLERGARDEAAFAVPLDVRLTAGSSPGEPLDAAPLRAYERLAADVRAYPLLRTTADAVGIGTAVQSATVLGLPSDALASMRWRSDYSAAPRARLVDAVRPERPVSLIGAALPAGARAVSMRVRISGTPLVLNLVLRDRSGRIRRFALGTARAGSSRLGAPVPSAGGTEVLALELTLPKAARAWLLHLAREGKVLRAPAGLVSLGPLTARTARTARGVTSWQGWLARGRGATVERRSGDQVTISYSFPEAGTLLLRPRQPTDGGPIPVIASPGVAAAAGAGRLLTLEFYESQLEARIVGTARRFPTLGRNEEFVVADASILSTAVDADAPGTATPAELWLAAPGAERGALERALGRPPFSLLDALFREQLAERARSEPLARGVVITLGAAALVALVLAAIGIWATVLSDLRDERDTFFDLEAQGASPELLRRHMRLRAAALLTFGLLGGILLGFVLSRLVVSLVQVTAGATDPYPPLVLDVGVGAAALALAALVAVSAIAVELTIRHAFRGEIPERASWSLE